MYRSGFISNGKESMKNGVINVYKEAGMTSFQVVYQIRKLTGEKKIGHTGTLDPDATGVLPVCIGKATKLVDSLMDSDKQYRATMLFGRKTDTQDVSGKTLESMDNSELHRILKEKDQALSIESSNSSVPGIFKETFRKFTGKIEQLPPMYSAVKVGGVKLVDAARKGREIERKERPAVIYSIEDIHISGWENNEEALTAEFTVNCSKGTYIRTLCEDMGAYLGIPACMEKLERTRTSGMDLSSAHTLCEIQNAKEEGRLEEMIIPTDRFLINFPSLTVTDEAVRKLLFGNYLSEEEIETKEESEEGRYRVYDKHGSFYALYYYDKKDHWYKCEKMFVDEPQASGMKK